MSNVRLRRRSISETLSSGLSSQSVVAVSPDHPLLISTADLLIGDDGRLTAIYLPLREELRRPSLLANRFILSRLAIPAHARHLLIVDKDVRESFVHHFANDFAAILRSDESDDLLTIVQDREFVGVQRRIPQDIVDGAKPQFSDLMQVTRVMKNLYLRRHRDRSAPQVEARKRGRALKRYSVIKEGETAEADFSDGRIESSTIRQLINAQVQAAYGLDGSIPYPRSSSYYGLATVQRLPEYRNDPEKLLRAAAFGGWVLISREQKEASVNLLGQLAERRIKRRR